QVAQLARDLGADRFSIRTGLPLRSQWSLTKHRWQRDSDPATARGVRRLSIAEWIVAGMGGDQASDGSLASRAGWPGPAGGARVVRGRGRARRCPGPRRWSPPEPRWAE